MHLTNILSLMSFLGIVTEISDVNLRLIIGRHSRILIRRLKTEGIIEVVYHALDVSLGYPRKNIII